MPPELRGPGRSGGVGLFGRIIATLATCAALAVAVMFSVVLLAVAAIGAAIFLGWLWWKSRHLRQQMRSTWAAESAAPPGNGSHPQAGDVIEGQVLRGEWKEDQKS